MKRLDIGELTEGSSALQLISTLPFTNVEKLSFQLGSQSWIRELGSRLEQCKSILSLLGPFTAEMFDSIRNLVIQGGSLATAKHNLSRF